MDVQDSDLLPLGLSFPGEGHGGAGADSDDINAPPSADPLVKTNASTNGQLDLGSLDFGEGSVIDGIASGDSLGRSVSPVGDFNGDGLHDFMISAPGAGTNGEVYLVFGTANGFNASFNPATLDGSDGFRLIGEASGDRLGLAKKSISAANDINNDGFKDIVLGAPAANSYNGLAYVVFGTDQPFGPSLSLTTLDGSDGFVLVGGSTSSAGFSVFAARDFNGDGFRDVLVGAPNADPDGRSNAGEAYVVFGSDQTFSSSISLSNLDGSDGIIFEGKAPGDNLGLSVAGTGDINGDGFDDAALGAPRRDSNTGEAYVVFGSDQSFGARFDLSDLTEDQGLTFTGLNPQDFVGFSLAGTNDVDGDGFPDLLIGAPGFDPGTGAYTGAAYLFIGRPFTFDKGKTLDDLHGQRLIRLDGEQANDVAGVSVSTAGDFNGTGFQDILIGARNADKAYVVFGRGDEGFPPEIELGDLDGSDGLVLDGVVTSGQAGYSVATARDIDGDGFDEILIGEPFSTAGTAYLVYGSPEYLPNLTKFGNNQANTLDGSGTPDVILGLGGKDSIFGRGGNDILYAGDGVDTANGGFGNDTILGGHGKDKLIGGGGADSLFGNGGDDNVSGGGGIDYVHGGTGNDDLLGGPGNDKLDGSTGDDYLDGGDGADTLLGRPGHDEMDGGTGNDKMFGGYDNDIMNGGAGRDVMYGNDGNDILNGGSENDTMRGNAGNDTYTVGQPGDKVIEKSNEGKDTVKSFVNFALPDNVEHLTLLGSANRSGTGNALVNKITGNSGANKLIGQGGNDKLFGMNGGDNLIGGPGNDLLNGGKGRDVMAGGPGRDTYFVDQGGDKITELSGGGVDTVKSSASYTLSANIEKLILTGNGAIDATGNNQPNTIKGNNKANEIDGAGGNDIMTGGGGNDIFVMSNNNGRDRITDFKSGQDKIDVVAYGFTTGSQVLNKASNKGGYVLIELNNSNSVRLNGVSKNQLKASDFIVKQVNKPPPDKIDLPNANSVDSDIDFQDMMIQGYNLDLGTLGQPGGGATLQSHSLAVASPLDAAGALDFDFLDLAAMAGLG